MQKRILILAPHTDDGEFGCGGAIAKLVSEGHDVHYIAFSAAEKSVSPEFPSDILRKEVVEATAVLGISSKNLEVLNFEVRDFPSHRQEILETMVRLQRDLDPDMVFLPSTSDTHQDHQTVSAEGFRAFKKTTILGYELPWNNLVFTTNSFVLLDKEHVDRKAEALLCYKSQAGRLYATGQYVENLANVRGTQIGSKYAEAFEVIRWILR
jgi:LmbE family N-acetylglucosaminyl deacetylase